MDTLRFITCGSVDDGKSTLIGRLLYETKKVFEDQLETLARDSRAFGTQGDKLDFALLVDGLAAEREQGITIDVAYRFFTTDKRRFIVADTPGHEQYTRNMATGASTADVAIILIDARKGVLVQTRRHSRIVRMMGIRSVALAINKMDLVDWSEDVFRKIESEYRSFAADLGIESVTAMPVSALNGENIVQRGAQVAPWYKGQTLLEWLETTQTSTREASAEAAMSVQWVNRPNADFRGFSGRVATGSFAVGDDVRVSPSGRQSRIAGIIDGTGETQKVEKGQSVTLVLKDEIDISRGDIIASSARPAQHADQFEADIIWLSDHALMPGRQYAFQLHRKSANATISTIKYRTDINSGSHLAAKTLGLNEIGVVTISADRQIPFMAYEQSRDLGSFILIDRISNETVGAGTIRHALRRADNIHWQSLEVTKAARAEIKMQAPRCLWLTGLSGSGKSTIANLLEKRLIADGRHTYILDGDNIRHGLNRDLGFTEQDRVENIRRVAEVARLMVDAGLIVIVSFISPYRSDRDAARQRFADREFVEVFVDAPIEICEARDVKGLYSKARRGEIKNFTGIDSLYEKPEHPELHIETDKISAEDAVEKILKHLLQ